MQRLATTHSVQTDDDDDRRTDATLHQ